MFQNLSEAEKTKEDIGNKKNILSNIISKKYVILYILTFMLSIVNMGYDVSPFSLAIIVACISAEIPVIAVIALAFIRKYSWGRAIINIKFYTYFIGVFCNIYCKRANL